MVVKSESGAFDGDSLLTACLKLEVHGGHGVATFFIPLTGLHSMDELQKQCSVFPENFQADADKHAPSKKLSVLA